MAALELTAVANVSAAVSGLKDVGRAAGDMAGDVGRAAASAASRMDTVGEAADGVGSRTSQAAGGLGDLAGGLQATGLVSESTAAAMETGAAAVQGLTGVMDLANLALTLQPVKWLAAKTGQVAYSVASKATAAAQWALNAAMSANPIGLLIIAIVALVAIFVVAYKRSETFRNIVNKAFSAVRAVAGVVIRAVIGFFVSFGSTVASVGGKVVGAIGRVITLVRGIPGKIKGALSGAGTWLVSAGKDVIRGLWNGLSSMAGWIKSKVIALVSSILPGPVKKVLGIASPSRLFKQYGRWTSEGLGIGIQQRAGMVADAASGLARKVADGFNAPSLTLDATARGSRAGNASSTQPAISITVTGALDPSAVAAQIQRLLKREQLRTGVL